MAVSIAVVGIGSFGRGFVRLVRDHPLVRRIALCDMHSDRVGKAAAEFGISETYASLEEVLKSDIDAVALFTQPWLHAPQAVQAMEAGKHVYSAVPVISLTNGEEMLEWCDRVVQTCKRTGQRYMMGETSYYRPQAMYCRRQAAEERFGQYVLAEGEYFHDTDTGGLRDVSRRRWGDQWSWSKTGDVPMHYPTHSVGAVLSVMRGPLVEVSAIGFTLPNDDWFRTDTESGNLFSNETALFRAANGAAVRICEYRRIGHKGREAFQLFGTAGSFRDGADGCHWMTTSGATPLTIEEMRDPLPPEVLDAYRHGQENDSQVYGGHGGSHAYLVNEFVQAIAAGRQPTVNAWEAARYLAPGVVAHQSALRGGELLKIPDWGDAPA